MEKIDNLQIGIAGEYLVCADLITKGFVAFPSEQGLSFDVVLEHNDRLFKLQVKTTRTFGFTPQRKTDIPVYRFQVGINGKNRRWTKYKKEQVDLFALVVLDKKQVAYIPNKNVSSTMNFRVPEFRGQYHDEQGEKIKEIVMELKQKGLNVTEISEKLDISLSSVYRYQSNVSLKQRGSNAGTYFDELTFEKCMEEILF